jgi:hypothetical protein
MTAMDDSRDKVALSPQVVAAKGLSILIVGFGMAVIFRKARTILHSFAPIEVAAYTLMCLCLATYTYYAYNKINEEEAKFCLWVMGIAVGFMLFFLAMAWGLPKD